MKRVLLLTMLIASLAFHADAQRVYKSAKKNNNNNNSSRPSTSSQVDIPKKEFHVRVAGTNAYWDIPGHPGYNDGVNQVQVWDLDNGADRKVRFIPSGDGYYYIKFSHNNYYLDVKGGHLNKDVHMQIYRPNRSDAQKFKVIHKGDGKFKILTVNGWALDCEGGGWKNGVRLQLWEDHGGRCQTFELIDANSNRKFYGN